jgi:hypothetical protein
LRRPTRTPRALSAGPHDRRGIAIVAHASNDLPASLHLRAAVSTIDRHPSAESATATTPPTESPNRFAAFVLAT